MASVSYIGENVFGGCKNVTLYGYAGTCAEEYAAENGLPFEAMELPAPEFGDPDRDGEITLQDALYILVIYARAITGTDAELDAEMLYACDVRGDGDVTLEDAICVLKYYTYHTLLHEDVSWYEITGNPDAPDAPGTADNPIPD